MTCQHTLTLFDLSFLEVVCKIRNIKFASSGESWRKMTKRQDERKKERKRLNKKKLNNLTRYIQCVCLHLYVFGYVGCNEKEGSKREFLGK